MSGTPPSSLCRGAVSVVCGLRYLVGSNHFAELRSVSDAWWLDSSIFFLCSDCQRNFHFVSTGSRLTVKNLQARSNRLEDVVMLYKSSITMQCTPQCKSNSWRAVPNPLHRRPTIFKLHMSLLKHYGISSDLRVDLKSEDSDSWYVFATGNTNPTR